MMTAKVTKQFDAPPAGIWKALTNPDDIKKYFFGTHVVSEWKVGSPIVFTGEWEGKPYEDKGTILELIPEKKLKYSYLSSFSGKEDIPENYANITYELTANGTGARLVIMQEGIENEERKSESESNWNYVLDELDKLISASV